MFQNLRTDNGIEGPISFRNMHDIRNIVQMPILPFDDLRGRIELREIMGLVDQVIAIPAIRLPPAADVQNPRSRRKARKLRLHANALCSPDSPERFDQGGSPLYQDPIIAKTIS